MAVPVVDDALQVGRRLVEPVVEGLPEVGALGEQVDALGRLEHVEVGHDPGHPVAPVHDALAVGPVLGEQADHLAEVLLCPCGPRFRLGEPVLQCVAGRRQPRVADPVVVLPERRGPPVALRLDGEVVEAPTLEQQLGPECLAGLLAQGLPGPGAGQRQPVAQPAGVEVVVGHVRLAPVREAQRRRQPALQLVEVVALSGQPVGKREVRRRRSEVGDAGVGVLGRERHRPVALALVQEAPELRGPYAVRRLPQVGQPTVQQQQTAVLVDVLDHDVLSGKGCAESVVDGAGPDSKRCRTDPEAPVRVTVSPCSSARRSRVPSGAGALPSTW